MPMKPELINNKPVKVFSETDIFRSSYTWEFLTFEQMRSIRFIQGSIFEDPRQAKFKILSLIVTVNHLETLLYDKINPKRERGNAYHIAYMKTKPDIFKNLDTANATQKLQQQLNGGEFFQLQLVMMIEEWVRALDYYMASMKKIATTSFEMAVPDENMEVVDMDIKGVE
jgi:hypothetical protein